MISEKDIEEINAEIKTTVLDAHKSAMTAPAPSEDSIYDYLYAPAYESTKYPTGEHNDSGEEIKFITAINEHS